jgi:aspartyl-tRNA(Asn)/glutamyl-tRNA(Gln) amidotransferase subunit A
MKCRTYSEIKGLLAGKKIGVLELTKEFIKRIKSSKLNAFVSFDEGLTLERARQVESNGLDGNLPLFGLPLAVKDNFCVRGYRATNGSKMLENYHPPFESTVTQRLLDGGVVIVGKANQDEFAMGSSTQSSAFGKTFSPYNLDGEFLIPGGSSGGSAVAVATGLAVCALGTDTGGSVRQPAAFTGLVGFKPTYGYCSRFGIISYASSFDQAGFFANCVEDVALLAQITGGKDGKDAGVNSDLIPDVYKNLNPTVKGKKIGIIKEFVEEYDKIDNQIINELDNVRKILENEGCEFVEVSIPHIKYCINIYNTVSRAEAASNFARYDGVKFGHRTKEAVSSIEQMFAKTRSEGFGTEVKNRILVGTAILLEEYRHIYDNLVQLRYQVKEEFNEAFAKVDAIFSPVSPILPPKISQKITQVEEYLFDLFTLCANVVGIPALTIPTGFSSDLRPIAVQLMGNSFCDQEILNIGLSLQKNINFLENPKNILNNKGM